MFHAVLKTGRDKSIKRRHPWIFSGAIAEVSGQPGVGETVEIRDSRGGFLAYGAYSPSSQIRIRIWSWNKNAQIDPDFLRTRLATAINYRKSPIFRAEAPLAGSHIQIAEPHQTLPTAIRLVHGESDGLPGLVVDKYGDSLVVQFLSAGPERWRETIADLLLELGDAQNILDRSDVDVRTLEGLPQRVSPIRGTPPDNVVITENGLRFAVGLISGQKTGFYLDQRENRLRVRNLTAGLEVLDCFSYTGGFTLNALVGGARSVTAVEESETALNAARENLKLNNLDGDQVEWLRADVFNQLRKFRDQARSFDLIVLDPPKFAPTPGHAKKAARGYKDINLLAFKLLSPGGILVTFSCSGGISAGLFQSIVSGAALDAGVTAQVSDHLQQSPDHPVALNFPEGAYLKGLVIRVAT
jgi:23S rRNA (cytosine1962-C5)-methyltransferase